jgi:hypothetical protein
VRRVRYVYQYQLERNKFHITKEVWALQLSLGNILRILPYHKFTLIHENTIIDQVAQDSLDTPISNCVIPCTNFKPFVIKSYSKRYQDSWNQQMQRRVRYVYQYQQERNKFHITKEVWALQLSLGNILRILPYHEFTLNRW